MTDFQPFAKKINKRFTEMSAGELFVTVDGDELWRHYLAAFPEGTNPIYKVRTEYDCSCCRNFIRNIGPVVSIVDGKLQSTWDVAGLEYPFDIVAAALNELVVNSAISNLFRVSERSYGNEHTKQLLAGTVIEWNHFYGTVATRHYTKTVDKDRGEYNTTTQVLKRGLTELHQSAISTVVDLIESNSLYRGAEHLPAIRAFSALLLQYNKLSSDVDQNTFVWSSASHPAARFRNTVIGTLIQDLSDGVELETAVRSFETKVAPTNYKRPTALITPRMVQDAMKTINELGYETALNRRFAKLSDVSVNNVLWVDNSVKGQMKDGIESVLMAAATTSKKASKKTAVDISIDDFMRTVLPIATSIDMFVSNQHQNNFACLTAPAGENSGSLFKWTNDFAWSYNGNITDSIKEKVKKAGGNVTNAQLRVSLAWFNFDDLDIHVYGPNGEHIYFANKMGLLDVDMNAGRGTTREPVENVSWTSERIKDGTYNVKVNQFNKRETSSVGFAVEVESAGAVTQLSYQQSVTGMVDVCSIVVNQGVVTTIKLGKGIASTGVSQEVWGVKTEDYVKVNTVMYSPNYWDNNAVGNKHWFFMLDNCVNSDATRGIYNEFLNSNLEKHRKVFEILGDKTKCQPTTDQLAGLGFSSTRGDTVTVKVISNNQQTVYNINF